MVQNKYPDWVLRTLKTIIERVNKVSSKSDVTVCYDAALASIQFTGCTVHFDKGFVQQFKCMEVFNRVMHEIHIIISNVIYHGLILLEEINYLTFLLDSFKVP